MTKQRLFPFPRLSSKAVHWGEWRARLDGDVIALDDLPDQWDASSELRFGISVRVDPRGFEDLGVSEPRLALTVACADTGFSVCDDVPLSDDDPARTAAADIRVDGSDVSQIVELRAEIIGRDDREAWLRRRILAEGPQSRVALNSELVGFPTSSYSFEKRGIPAAPWRISVAADSLDAPFVHSVRLELNDDYQSIRKLISSRAEPAVKAELDASITRVLIATVSKLWDAGEGRLEDVAAEYPDSIAAAAQRAAEQRAALTLGEAVNRYRMRPEELEYAIASKLQILKG